MAKSSVKHRAISVRQGNNLAILAHKTGINRPASTYACVWKKIQGEADRHETDPPPAAQHLPCAEPPHAAAHPCVGRAGGGFVLWRAAGPAVYPANTGPQRLRQPCRGPAAAGYHAARRPRRNLFRRWRYPGRQQNLLDHPGLPAGTGG